MLLRYFFIVFGGSSYDNPVAEAERSSQRQRVGETVIASNDWGNGIQPSVSGWELVTWDIGVACLALSVKVGVILFGFSLSAIHADCIVFFF